MVKMMTQLELRIKHVMGVPTKMQNVMEYNGYDEQEDKTPDKEI